MRRGSISQIRPFILLSAVAALAVGCANPDLGGLQAFVAQEKQKRPGRVDPIPEIKQVDTFLYDDQGRRDPFTPMEPQEAAAAVVADDGIRPDFNRRKEELESYSLDSIRLVGLLEKDGVTWGLVSTKDGTIHRVKNGNRMGRNHGRIISVTEDKIELTEIVEDGSGGYKERLASLTLTE